MFAGLKGRTRIVGYRVLVIGRSRRADICLRDGSVSRLHAELTLADDGTLHVSDKLSTNGTWIDENERWRRLTQRKVRPADRLRLGRVEIEVSELLRRAPAGLAAGSGGYREEGRGRSGNVGGSSLPAGPVRRNPETGEVIAD